MSIPGFQELMLPFMEYVADGKEHSLRELIENLASHFGLSDTQRKELLPSGKQTIFNNRVGWTRTYLKKAGLIESPQKAHFKITSRGLECLKEKPVEINVKFLKRYPEFISFQTNKKEEENTGVDILDQTSPEEALELSYQKIRQDLALEILEAIKKCSPGFFEKLVVELLVNMGYGGSRRDAGEAIGQSGDGGIDGIIKEDRLGLDIIYIQAKRWQGTVGRPEIQKFAGALLGKSAKKGIFLTTSCFSKEATDYATVIESKIVLIDGEKLANLMIDFGVGVSNVATYELKRIDSDYFTEE